jgi:sarcosine oxidase, subunit gamma
MIAKESPLKGMNKGTVGTVAIRELPGLSTIDLRAEQGSSMHAAITNVPGIDLPLKPGQSSVTGVPETYTLCLAPDWWLIVGLNEVEQQLAVLRLNNDYHFSSVNVSGQRTTIELEGPNARKVLAHLWEQDLREKSFPVGSVSQGLMAKAPVIVFHIAAFRYRVMVRSSFALHLWKALVDAAEEWL